jgi:RNA polymerase sigma-19 factor, ECF subfamily
MNDRDPQKSATFVREIAEAHGPRLRQYLTRRLRPGEDAQDIAQEVYLRLLRLHRSDLVLNTAAYTYFIAEQVLAQRRKDEAMKPLVYDSDLVEHLAEHSELMASSDSHEQEHSRRELHRLLRKLDAVRRTVFLLRKRDGFSIAEIAEELGMSHFKVKRYLVEANAILASKLRDGR